jgi:hypothetical protein
VSGPAPRAPPSLGCMRARSARAQALPRRSRGSAVCVPALRGQAQCAPTQCVCCVCGNQPLVGQHRGVVCCWHASGVAPWPPSQAQHPGRDQGRVPHAELLPCRCSCPLAAAPWILLPFPPSRGLAVVRKVTSSSNAPAGCTATQSSDNLWPRNPPHARNLCVRRGELLWLAMPRGLRELPITG